MQYFYAATGNACMCVCVCYDKYHYAKYIIVECYNLENFGFFFSIIACTAVMMSPDCNIDMFQAA